MDKVLRKGGIGARTIAVEPKIALLWLRVPLVLVWNEHIPGVVFATLRSIVWQESAGHRVRPSKKAVGLTNKKLAQTGGQ
jgi:hypothetical protein